MLIVVVIDVCSAAHEVREMTVIGAAREWLGLVSGRCRALIHTLWYRLNAGMRERGNVLCLMIKCAEDDDDNSVDDTVERGDLLFALSLD